VLLSESIPDTLKLKMLKKMMQRIIRESERTRGDLGVDQEQYVYAKSDNNARELLEKIKLKYPEVHDMLIKELYKALKNGKIDSVDGILIYNVIVALNLDVKPDIKNKIY